MTNLTNKLKPIFTGLLASLERLQSIVIMLFNGVKQRVIASANAFKLPDLIQWASQYTPSQLCYFSAAILLVVAIFSGDDLLPVVALLAFIGLLRELINIFHRIWHTTIGTGFIILLYASTANLALAYAAQKINFITGIEPTPFIFTLGFTTLILMPFWIALSSVLVFLTVLVVANLWLLASVLLRIIGLKVQVHWEDKKRAFLTMILRIILIPLVLVHLITIMLPYASGNFVRDDLGLKVGVEGFSMELYTTDDETTSAQSPNNKTLNTTVQNPEAENTSEQALSEEDKLAIQEGQRIVDNIHVKQLFIERMIAHFIFYLESYSQSACMKAQDQHSVIIDENMILLIRKNDEAVHGYDYEVTKCTPNLKAPSQVIGNK